MPTLTVPLWRLAHGRSGDKGNRSNISVIAWEPELFALIVGRVDEAAVLRLFAFRRPTAVTRYLLPKLHAMNFVIENILDGGVNDSLNLDMHGKALSFHLLTMTVWVPLEVAPLLRGPDASTTSMETTR